MITTVHNRLNTLNCLLLHHVNQNWYDFLAEQINLYFKKTVRLNYSELFVKEGNDGTEFHINNLVDSEHIDIIIIFAFANNYELSLSFLKKLKEKAYIVFWFFDDETYLDAHSKYFAQVADAVITADYFARSAYEQMDIPAVFYFNSHSKKDYYPVKLNKDIDVSFIGACDKGNRMEYIDYLRSNQVSIKVYGKGSPNGFVDKRQMVTLFSQSKINLNFTEMDQPHFIVDENPLLPRIRQWKSRPIEIALTQSFCLSEYAPGINNLFEIGKEMDVFYTKEDLLSKIKHYLEYDDQRECMAQLAYDKAVSTYESSIHIPKVLREMTQILAAGSDRRFFYKEIFTGYSFRKRHIAFLTVKLFSQLKWFRLKNAVEIYFSLFQYGLKVLIPGFFAGIADVITLLLKRTNSIEENN